MFTPSAFDTAMSSVPPSPNPAPLKRRRLDDTASGVDTTATSSNTSSPSSHPFTLLTQDYSAMTISSLPYSAAASHPSSGSLFALLSEDLLVCICEHFELRELALLDRVCRMFRSLLTLPTARNAFEAAQLHGHAANYIWRNAALNAKAWPFPSYIDREHLERVVLKHLKKLPPRSGPLLSSPISFDMSCEDDFSYAAGESGMNPELVSAFLHAHQHGQSPLQRPMPSASSSSSSSSSDGSLTPPLHAQQAVLPPLNWKSILASVESRTSRNGTGTLVLDMGSCTVSLGLGGVEAGVHGSRLPTSFPAIALDDLVGDQVGSQSVRTVNPVSSISMPILHANETGEFSYCSPIWKHALQRVPEEAYCGRTTTTTDDDDESASLSSSMQAAAQAMSDASHASEGGTVLICDQLLGSKLELAKKRAKVARILFALQPPNAANKVKLAFCNESFLSLLNLGKTTGVVLHVGFSRSTCAIFVNGRIQNLNSFPTRMVGGHIHARIMLQALFSRRQFQPAVADMFAVIPLLKEQCYCAEDTAAEQQKPREVTHVEITISDKKLTLGHERFTSSDVFFLYGFPAMVVEALQSSPAWPVLQPAPHALAAAPTVTPLSLSQSASYELDALANSALMQHVPEESLMSDVEPSVGASTTISSNVTSVEKLQAIYAEIRTAQAEAKHDKALTTPVDVAAESLGSSSGRQALELMRAGASSSPPADSEEDGPHQLIKTLLQNIVLSGRSTAIRGFGPRFERDLNAILNQSTPAKVHENHVECTWLGGSVLSSLSVFPALGITRDEFAQDGINAILRHMEI